MARRMGSEINMWLAVADEDDAALARRLRAHRHSAGMGRRCILHSWLDKLIWSHGLRLCGCKITGPKTGYIRKRADLLMRQGGGQGKTGALDAEHGPIYGPSS